MNHQHVQKALVFFGAGLVLRFLPMAVIRIADPKTEDILFLIGQAIAILGLASFASAFFIGDAKKWAWAATITTSLVGGFWMLPGLLRAEKLMPSGELPYAIAGTFAIYALFGWLASLITNKVTKNWQPSPRLEPEVER